MISKLFLIFLCSLIPLFLLGQNIYIPIDDVVYHYLDYQITKGNVKPHFILNQPYRFNEIFKSTDAKERIYFRNYWQQYFINHKANIFFKVSDAGKWDKTLLNRYRFDGGVSFANKYLTLVNQTTVDEEYKHDPNFAGDLSESDHWLYGRVNEAYADFHSNKITVFYGRTHRNWGALGDYGLILSGNPYTYDHILIVLKMERIKFSLIYAQLDTRPTLYKYEQYEPVFKIQSARRNLVGHRLDIHVSDKFQFALTEMATYGGENRPFEWAFLNPMDFYYPIQRNDKKQMDGFWCVDAFWNPFSKTAIWGQFLLDDIIVNNNPGVDDRGKYPDRFGVLTSFRHADLFFGGTLWAFSFVKIWNRTYQSKFSWENYHYRGYGLGYPAPGLEEFKFKLDVWKYFPFYFSNELIYGKYGSVSVTDLFPLIKESFPLPPVTYNLINHFQAYYFVSKKVKVFFDVWFRRHANHYSNRFSEHAGIVAKLGFQYSTNLGFRIE